MNGVSSPGELLREHCAGECVGGFYESAPHFCATSHAAEFVAGRDILAKAWSRWRHMPISAVLDVVPMFPI